MNRSMWRSIRTNLWRLRTRVAQELDFFRHIRAAPPIVVYQMGKVASISITDSLRTFWPGLVVNTHNLVDDAPEVKWVARNYIPKGQALYIITPVREPIGRNISAFFQNFERDTGVSHARSSFTTDELVRLFLENYHHDIPLDWFDVQMRKRLGIDVYEHGFPATGIQTIASGPIRLLILRSELADSVKQAAISRFLDIPDFVITRKNSGEDKEYASTYKKFIEAFRAPDWYITKMYGSKYFRHFYGDEFRDALVTKWAPHKIANGE